MRADFRGVHTRMMAYSKVKHVMPLERNWKKRVQTLVPTGSSKHWLLQTSAVSQPGTSVAQALTLKTRRLRPRERKCLAQDRAGD